LHRGTKKLIPLEQKQIKGGIIFWAGHNKALASTQGTKHHTTTKGTQLCTLEQKFSNRGTKTSTKRNKS
jgi:hypothetical protein